MPTENKPAEPGFDLNTPNGGRGYITNLFKTVLKRLRLTHGCATRSPYEPPQRVAVRNPAPVSETHFFPNNGESS